MVGLEERLAANGSNRSGFRLKETLANRWGFRLKGTLAAMVARRLGLTQGNASGNGRPMARACLQGKR